MMVIGYLKIEALIKYLLSHLFSFFLHILYFGFSLCFYPCNHTVYTKANRMFHGLLNAAKQ